jgi:hypothetical protein
MTVAFRQRTVEVALLERPRRVGSERSSEPRDDLYRTFRDSQSTVDRSGKQDHIRLDKECIRCHGYLQMSQCQLNTDVACLLGLDLTQR